MPPALLATLATCPPDHQVAPLLPWGVYLATLPPYTRQLQIHTSSPPPPPPPHPLLLWLLPQAPGHPGLPGRQAGGGGGRRQGPAQVQGGVGCGCPWQGGEGSSEEGAVGGAGGGGGAQGGGELPNMPGTIQCIHSTQLGTPQKSSKSLVLSQKFSPRTRWSVPAGCPAPTCSAGPASIGGWRGAT